MIRILLLSLFIIILVGCDSTEVESTPAVNFKLSPEYQEALQALQEMSAVDNATFLIEKLGRANRLYGVEAVAQLRNKSDSLLSIRGSEGLSESDFSDIQSKIFRDLYKESPKRKDVELTFSEALRKLTASYPEVNPVEMGQSLKADIQVYLLDQ